MMTVLEKRRDELDGRYLSESEALALTSRLSLSDGWIFDLMRQYPLIGMNFKLLPEQDLSGFGAQFRWMTPENMIQESLEYYPGIAAMRTGYIPVGQCLFGSGDPYFVKLASEDSPLVRIPHDRLETDLSLSESVIETVCPQLSDLFQMALFG